MTDGYDSDMELFYSDDAATFDVWITIVHPETGESKTAGVDNLTSAMYFIVKNGLMPIREGMQEQTGLVTGDPTAHMPSVQDALKEVGVTGEQLLNAWREQNLHPIALTITCEGDPNLLDQLTIQ
jgi:hypothetical protein